MFRHGSGNIFEECSPNRKSRQHINMYECCLKTFLQNMPITNAYIIMNVFRKRTSNRCKTFAKKPKTFSDNIMKTFLEARAVLLTKGTHN